MRPVRLLLLLSAAALLAGVRADEHEPEYPRPVKNNLEAQIALARRDFSCGSIDGAIGTNTANTLRAFQAANSLDVTGTLDAETRDALTIARPALKEATITAEDIQRLQPLGKDFQAKAAQTALDYETILELIAERFHCSPALIKRLNPNIDWTQPTPVNPGDPLQVPDPASDVHRHPGARILVSLVDRTLDVLDGDDKILAHFPCSIAAKVEKRPEGELHVVNKALNPTYTLDPENFPESQELQAFGHKLILPAGPNNPVGLVWIGLDKPGYGIHGTPDPEKIGRTESHGCFRMTNWDATALIGYVEIGTPVDVAQK